MVAKFLPLISKQVGFSLIEIMVVVAIVGLTVAITFPTSNHVNGESLYLQNKIQLRDILQQARNLARTKQECVTVDIQPQAVTVTSFAMPAPCIPPFSNQDVQIVKNFDASVTLAPFFASAPLIFNPRGGTDYNAVSQMQMQAYGKAVNFSIYSLTGQIREN